MSFSVPRAASGDMHLPRSGCRNHSKHEPKISKGTTSQHLNIQYQPMAGTDGKSKKSKPRKQILTHFQLPRGQGSGAFDLDSIFSDHQVTISDNEFVSDREARIRDELHGVGCLLEHCKLWQVGVQSDREVPVHQR